MSYTPQHDRDLKRLDGAVMEDWGHTDCDVCTDARASKLSTAQEGVVKALLPFAREVGFLRKQGELMNDNDRIGRPLSVTKSATRLVLANLLDARAALDELRAAEGKAPPMTEEETESEERQGAADARRESLEDPLD